MNHAFTMAEILLSLTIIGVVAAITLPSLTGNINERTWNTQRKALYARFSQAIALMPALNGYGTLTEGDSSTSAVDTAAETFVTSGLAKVMKINNICDYEHLEDCGITSKINTINNSTITPFPQTLVEFNPLFSNSLSGGWDYQQIDTKAVAFETANGESIVTYYNPYCISDLDELNSERTWYHSQSKMCANFIYDLNGKKGPNTVGKDIGFITVLYPSDPIVVAPMPTNNDAPNKLIHIQAVAYCKQEDSESRLPNIDEASAMFYNKPLLGFKNENYWTSTVYSSTKAWYQSFSAGDRYHIDKSTPEYVRCVKR